MQGNELLSFGLGGYGRGSQSISIRVGEDGSYLVSRTKSYSYDDVVNEELSLDRSCFDAFIEAAEKMGVFDWEPRYVKCPMDGSDWDLAINCEGHEGFKSRGASAQPSEFYDFLTLLQDIGFW